MNVSVMLFLISVMEKDSPLPTTKVTPCPDSAVGVKVVLIMNDDYSWNSCSDHFRKKNETITLVL